MKKVNYTKKGVRCKGYMLRLPRTITKVATPPIKERQAMTSTNLNGGGMGGEVSPHLSRADTRVCRALEALYEALRAKGITLTGLELSKALTLFGKDTRDIALDFGLGYNRKHIKVVAKAAASPTPTKPNKGKTLKQESKK